MLLAIHTVVNIKLSICNRKKVAQVLYNLNTFTKMFRKVKACKILVILAKHCKITQVSEVATTKSMFSGE